MPHAPRREIQRAGVVGAGTSGRGVARAMAAAGIEVVLVERTEGSLERAVLLLRESMDRDIARWAMTESERDAVWSRIMGTVDPAKLNDVEFVVEAVPEDFKEKVAVLQALSEVIPDEAPFLLNTSTLSVTALAESLPERRRPSVIGLHFLHPVTRIPLVELVRGRESGEDAEAIARNLASRLGKQVMEVAEYPGYVTSRLTLALINEAVNLLSEGVATRDVVDHAMKLRLSASHGPLALADEIGLDSVHRALESLWRELGLPQFRPAPLLRRMVNEGWLGEKTGRGFYNYDESGRRSPAELDFTSPTLEELLDPGAGPDASDAD
ncbi:MAG: 3-hydroxyacyl-CoA dehydrogenase NAD-binding domain-containing protein [Gemmatimonadota bacterium]